MTDFVDKLKLKEQAEEDTWFARRDRELIEALRARRAPLRYPSRVVSGGQTGVDRAALDAGREVGLEIGGWCPRGRRAEDGAVAGDYPLRETPSRRYAERTEWNVRDSDATLILHRGGLSGGTRLTAGIAARLGRPLLVVDLATAEADPAPVREWIRNRRAAVLNVAGPRESGDPGIGSAAYAFLLRVLHPDGVGR